MLIKRTRCPRPLTVGAGFSRRGLQSLPDMGRRCKAVALCDSGGGREKVKRKNTAGYFCSVLGETRGIFCTIGFAGGSKKPPSWPGYQLQGRPGIINPDPVSSPIAAGRLAGELGRRHRQTPFSAYDYVRT